MAITKGAQQPTVTHGLAEVGQLVRAAHGSRNTTVSADIVTMREAAEELLGPDDVPGVLPPSPPELRLLSSVLRGHLGLLIPEVEMRAHRLPEESVLRYCALACVGEARRKLSAEPCRRYGGEVGHARRLARVLRALCDHCEALAQRLTVKQQAETKDVPTERSGNTNHHE
ncbi:DUF6415 family natural product biosynthesis protein [Streptomyces sp. NPDC004270]